MLSYAMFYSILFCSVLRYYALPLVTEQLESCPSADSISPATLDIPATIHFKKDFKHTYG